VYVIESTDARSTVQRSFPLAAGVAHFDSTTRPNSVPK
jgi:hypothetical protein